MYDADVDPVELPFGLGSIDYTAYTNRQLVAVPLTVLALALVVLVVWTAVVPPVGVPVDRGIDFTGGTEVEIQASDSRAEVEQTFEQRFGDDLVGVQGVQAKDGHFVVTFHAVDAGEVERHAADAGYETVKIQETSATFGARSQVQALYGLGLAFLGMSALVFLLFRTFVPSIAVVISAFSDIVIPLALMNLLGIELTLGTVAALLMLIGYSVDSDILLNNHVLRRRGSFYESAYSAMRTGVTMTLTSISALIVMTVVASMFQIPLMPAIGTVLVMGLAADLMNTYMLNLSLLRWYKYEGVAR